MLFVGLEERRRGISKSGYTLDDRSRHALSVFFEFELSHGLIDSSAEYSPCRCVLPSLFQLVAQVSCFHSHDQDREPPYCEVSGKFDMGLLQFLCSCYLAL